MASCQSLGGAANATLASVLTLQENRHIEANMEEANIYPMLLPYWIGMYKYPQGLYNEFVVLYSKKKMSVKIILISGV